MQIILYLFFVYFTGNQTVTFKFTEPLMEQNSEIILYQTEDGITKIEEGELQPHSTVKEYLTVQTEGIRQVKRLTQFYNLKVACRCQFIQ